MNSIAYFANHPDFYDYLKEDPSLTREECDAFDNPETYKGIKVTYHCPNGGYLAFNIKVGNNLFGVNLELRENYDYRFKTTQAIAHREIDLMYKKLLS